MNGWHTRPACQRQTGSDGARPRDRGQFRWICGVKWRAELREASVNTLRVSLSVADLRPPLAVCPQQKFVMAKAEHQKTM